MDLKPFTKLSIEASKGNGVCWNYTCTTCGCRDFMNLLVKHSGLEIEKFDRYGHNNNMLDQKNILTFYKDIDIKELLEHSKFPDFLGHLGLLFYSCNKYLTLDDEIATSIIKQVNEISDEKLPSYIFDRGESKRKRLNIDDLERIEVFLKRNYLNKSN
jgi:hypothetical protein